MLEKGDIGPLDIQVTIREFHKLIHFLDALPMVQ